MSSLSSLPAYLRKYVVDQDYDAYTPLEHATWRYIMRQSRAFFSEHAVPIYLDGLKRTGIAVDRIPRISDMDRCLNEFGWGAVGVEGFIPSSVFLDLLARHILPIATDMRTLDHIGYTPAPDIVHEAAGHAPIIADADYRDFLSSYSDIAYRALISSEDIALYEAIRYLSDIKENPDTASALISQATERLKTTYLQQTYVSEATKVARLGWWTIEYGLVRNPSDKTNSPLRIYGAGLLSSIDESRACLGEQVAKIPLTAACVEQGYDITEPQPQLYVAETLGALTDVLKSVEENFVFRVGGKSGLQAMLQAATINTIMLDSGVSASGKLAHYLCNDRNEPEFFKFDGPSQLAYQEREIKAQGRERHPHGFSSPIGRWQNIAERDPSLLSSTELRDLGLKEGERCNLTLASGFNISGRLESTTRHHERLLLLTWNDCSVRRGDQVFFEPSWGAFDQVIGTDIVSVFAGPADRSAFGDYGIGKASTSPGRTSTYTKDELAHFDLYQSLRKLRSSAATTPKLALTQQLEALAHSMYQMQHHQHLWLAALELKELAARFTDLKSDNARWLQQLTAQFLSAQLGLAKSQGDHAVHIERGLKLVNIGD